MGQVHVEVIVRPHEARFGVEVELHPPRVPYRETIRGAKAQGRHKKQTGGRGQFGDTWIEVEPLPRGEGYEFVDEIVGGVIPRNFIPAVEKGMHRSHGGGPRGRLSGGRRARHPLRRLAPRGGLVRDGLQDRRLAGFKKAMREAQPSLLEPIMNVEVTCPKRTSATSSATSTRGAAACWA